MRYKFLSVLLVSIAVFVVLVSAISRRDSEYFQENRAIIMMRAIGHQLLLASHDSSSRVLPVKELGPGIFQLEFENKFSFAPDTLVGIVKSNLESLAQPMNFMVNVFECHSHEIIYAFEINPEKKDIIPCQGREQPAGCYNIQVAFVDFPSESNLVKTYFPHALALLGIALVGFVGNLLRKKKPQQTFPARAIIIGNTYFSPENRQLKFDRVIIDLSDKETRLLKIFAANLNQLILREKLLKEVWEDEGVITGRSLDMFISKLRKKLKNDSSLSIVNAHGQGYKLEVS